ncbi:MAG: fibronectin type III domain-containing protein [Thermodesulfovibrio sp.]|nr:fibronectin type III domain-containing protein [Thermodesulfovibrio sp.]MCX7724101.1 fibronectin type III domain-containing protein [Thermodesulfovibrio sp.]MDW7973286.1 fibronectin type III domain-containing protein [Thermodesulfovibrio sp.]
MFNDKYSLSSKKNYICLLIFLLILLSGCGRKADPTMEDYLQPEPVQNLSLTATHDKILITWNYPEKAKEKIKSFLIERQNNSEIKVLGYYDKNTTSLQDTEFQFEKTYKYRIFAITPKGIYSKPTEAVITTKKLQEVEKINYKITLHGVLLSWTLNDSLVYNIYRVNKNNEKIKIGSTDKDFFLDELLYSTINDFTDPLMPELSYFITTSISYGSTYIESKGTNIKIPLDSFIPSKPEEVFWAINEHGVYISWKEVSEKWFKGYRIYRKGKNEKEFRPIGETMIPLFFDADYNINKKEETIYYRITTIGPLKESEPVEIKVEVQSG